MLTLPIHPKRFLTAQLFWRFFLLSLPVIVVGDAALSYAAFGQLRSQASQNLAGIAADRASKIEAYARGKVREIQFLAAQPYMPGLVTISRTLDLDGRAGRTRRRSRLTHQVRPS